MTRGPRERLLDSAITLVRQRGVEGTGLSDLLEHSGTARGSIYQHFPRGKDELIEASTRRAGEFFRTGIIATIAHDPTPAAVIEVMVGHSKRILTDSKYAEGCPIVAASASGSPTVQAAAGEVFAGWASELSAFFVTLGRSREDADSLASFAISALEGAIVQARSRRSVQPLDDARRQLLTLVSAT